MSDAKEGSQIGAYILDWRLGGGSFGEVWRGHEAATGEPVAVKLLTGMLSSPNNAAMRAEVETLAAAAAGQSQHIVKVLGGGTEPTPYIVMEYVEGSDLSALLKDGGRLSSEKTIDIGVGVAKALAALNEAGIVHRDIKPANVMVDNKGVVKLADFGIAKIVGYETVTMTGQVAMTMAYAAPEVWDDDSPFGRPSHQSDLYALGILLFQCLTGETPFRGNYGALYRQHTERPPDLTALPADVPASLRQLVRQCLEKRPPSRPADAFACLVMLERAQAELKEKRQGGLSTEPSRFGQWVKLSPHASQPWAWRCRHDGTQEEATVEVQFSDDLDYGTKLRKAVSASPKLAVHGGERVLETNRLLMRPGETWQAAPKGMYQFWVAREDVPQTSPTLVTLAMLHTATLAIANLLADAAWEGLTLSIGSEDLSVQASGMVYLRRPGLIQGSGEASEQALATLRTLPLDTAARDFIARATSFDGLVQQFGSQGQPPSVQEDATALWANATQIAPAAAAGVTQFVPSSAAAAPSTPQPDPAMVSARVPAQDSASLSNLRLQLLPAGGSKPSDEFELVLHNTGALPMQVMLDAYDSGGQLTFQLPQQVMVREAASQRVRLQVSPRGRSRRATPFTVAAAGAGGVGQPPITIDGMWEPQPGRSMIPILGAVAGIALAAILGFVLLSGGGKDDKAKNANGAAPGGANGGEAAADFTPTPVPVATPAPVATPVPQPTPEPVVIPPPTPEPAVAPVIRSCDQIRGTPYQSEEEHQFFIANCGTPPTPVRNATGGGAAGGGATGGGTTGGAGGGAGGTGGGTAPVATPVPVVAPPTPAPVVKTPATISSVTCKSSIGTATVSNVGPASTQNGRFNAAANDTISCSASVTGDYTSLAWTGPQNSGGGGSFSTQVGGAKPGGAPYDVGLQVNWNGNPPIVHFSIVIDTSAAGSGGGNCKIVNGVQACIGGP